MHLQPFPPSDTFGKGELIAEPLNKELTHCLLARVRRVQRVGGVHITMEECGTGKASFVVGLVDDPVQGTLELAPRPLHDHVAAIDHVHILQGLHWEPRFLALFPYFKPVLSRLLEEHGDTSKVLVGADAELSWKCRSQRWITNHLHLHHGLLGKRLHDGQRVTKSEKQDLPDCLAQARRCLVVLPYWIPEFVIWQVGPDIGAIEAVVLDDGVFSADVISLDLWLATLFPERN